MNNLTKEQLLAIGVNPENMKYPFGAMNIIVQCFGQKDVEERDGKVYPDIYQPRKNRVWSCGCSGQEIPIGTEQERKDWVAHLRDSAERLKIMAHKLQNQAEEVERLGYPETTLYYPE